MLTLYSESGEVDEQSLNKTENVSDDDESLGFRHANGVTNDAAGDNEERCRFADGTVNIPPH